MSHKRKYQKKEELEERREQKNRRKKNYQNKEKLGAKLTRLGLEGKRNIFIKEGLL